MQWNKIAKEAHEFKKEVAIKILLKYTIIYRHIN